MTEASKVLPLSAVLELQRAAKTPITKADPLARVKAIEKVMAKVRLNYPQFFAQE